MLTKYKSTIQGLRLANFTQIRLVYILLFAIIIFFIGLFYTNIVHAEAKNQVVASNEHIISVYDTNKEIGFITKKDTLREAFKEQNIYIDSKDLVEPGLDSKLVAKSYQFNIYRARPVTIIDGPVRTKVITAHKTAKQIVREAGITLQNEDIAKIEVSSDPLANGSAEVLKITRATMFTFNFYGKLSVAYTQSKTVGDMLRAKGIILSPKDGTEPNVTTPIVSGMIVRLWRDGVQVLNTEEPIPFTTKIIYDNDQPASYKQIQSVGKDGLRAVTYEVNIQNGQEVSRSMINSVVLNEPLEQTEVHGSKNNYSSNLNEWLLALRTCETGGRYDRNSGNGYFGAYQFLPSTWDNIARKTGRPDLVGVLPSNASPADQDVLVVANANITAGLSTQHPGCYKKLGLSNKPPM